MRGRIVAGLFLCSLFFVVGGDAQSPNIPEKPVWTLGFIKVSPENYLSVLDQLDLSFAKTPAERQLAAVALLRRHFGEGQGLGFELPSAIVVIGRNGRKLESASVLEVAVNA